MSTRSLFACAESTPHGYRELSVAAFNLTGGMLAYAAAGLAVER